MKLGRKIIIVLLLIIGITSLLVGSIAYYKIVVSGNIEGSTGNAVFVLRDTEEGESWNNKVINFGQINPGDSGSFDVVMDASGSTVDMYATLSIDRTNLPTNLKFYTTSDHKSELHKYYSFLEKNGTNKEKLTIYWYWNPNIDDVSDSRFMNMSFSTSINVNAVQISEYAMMKNGNSASSSYRLYFWKDSYRPYIKTIDFVNDLRGLPSSCSGESDLCWDISYNYDQKKKVYAYLVDSGLKDSTDTTKSLYNLYIASDAPIFAPSSIYYMFSDFKNVETIKFDNFNTSKVENMGYLFCNSGFSNKLTTLDLSGFNTLKVKNMTSMFRNCLLLTSLDLSNFNTQNVIDMSHMFEGFDDKMSLLSLDLSSFNTSKVTSMTYMFRKCSSLLNLRIDSFDTTNVTNMSCMFEKCSSLTSLDLSNFNVSNVTDMQSMFSECSSLKYVNLSNFNTTNVQYISGMFYNCQSLASLDLSSFNTEKVVSVGNMFENCKSLVSLDLSNFNTSNVISAKSMFEGCSSLTSLNLSSFDTSNVMSMVRMFYGCSSLTNLDLSNFNTSNTSSMGLMFGYCENIVTEINITNTYLNYDGIFDSAATNEGACITVNYITSTSDIVDQIIAKKNSISNVIKGKLIPEYSITISGNDDITYERIDGVKGSKVTLTSISGNNYVTSFKMNGTLVNGNEFYMPGSNVTITDIVAVACKTIETEHYPYQASQTNLDLGEYTFENAKSLTVILDYEIGWYYDYFYIYDSSTATIGTKYYSLDRTKETVTIDSNYIKIVFTSNTSNSNYAYGLKAIVIPNY